MSLDIHIDTIHGKAGWSIRIMDHSTTFMTMHVEYWREMLRLVNTFLAQRYHLSDPERKKVVAIVDAENELEKEALKTRILNRAMTETLYHEARIAARGKYEWDKTEVDDYSWEMVGARLKSKTLVEWEGAHILFNQFFAEHMADLIAREGDPKK